MITVIFLYIVKQKDNNYLESLLICFPSLCMRAEDLYNIRLIVKSINSVYVSLWHEMRFEW